MKKPTFLIYIPTNRNPNFVQTSLLCLHSAIMHSDDLKSRIQVVVAASPSNAAIIEKIVKSFKLGGYTIELSVGTEYLEKVQNVFERFSSKKFTYFIKHDDDVLIPPLVWQMFLAKSPNELNKKDVLLTSVNLSTGIPSWLYFCETFFTTQQKSVLFNILKKTHVPNKIWGHDYSSLNTIIKTFKKWDENAYWNAMNNFGYHYRGLHPIRLYIELTFYIHKFILANYAIFNKWKPENSFTTITDRYFCNNFFMMKYDKYKKIISSKDLFVDQFDEIPLNQYCLKNGMSMSFLVNSIGVHLSYNTTYDQKIIYNGRTITGRELEYTYLKEFYEELQKLANAKGVTLVGLNWYKEPFLDQFVHFIGSFTRGTFIYPVLEKILKILKGGASK